MKFTIKTHDIVNSFDALKDKIDAEALVIAEYKSSTKKAKLSNLFTQVDKLLSKELSALVSDEKFEFNQAETLVYRIPASLRTKLKITNIKKIILLGLGEEDKAKTLPTIQRKSLAALVRKVKAEKLASYAIASYDQIELQIETPILINYEFNKYKSKSKDEKDIKIELSHVTIFNKSYGAKDKACIKAAESIARATCKARDLVWEPACTVTPTFLAKEAKKIKGAGLTTKILEKAECKKLGMGAFLAVAEGSDQLPKFIEMSYKPKGKVKKHIAVIGKGVTFDSGGLSLKPPKAMEMMKEDMSGSAAVIGVMNAIAELQPAGVQVTGIIAATENMPSGKAYRPGDVITAMNGKTIEVNNTDAEGRLTLADAVTYASTKNPDEIIDIATLTGACLVALGNVCAGLMTNNQDLLDRVKTSAENTGELVWQLPLYDEYKSKLKSSIADLINAGSGGKAGAQNGGLFIQEFIGKQKKSDEQIPWLHMDIAGPCWLDEDNDWSPKGASGVPVRTLLDYILSYSK
jgi:leucyl aminopeptidase